MVEIPVSGGRMALVDDEDSWVTKYQWFVITSKRPRKYVMCKPTNSELLLLHRLLMNPPKDMVVDHINGDTFDNRRANLRICTQAENAMNTLNKIGTSGYRGVYRTRHGLWIARLKHRNVNQTVGIFKTPLEAHLAWMKRAQELRGEFFHPGTRK